MPQPNIVEHPFFDDDAEAFQAAAWKELGAEGRRRLRQTDCALFPSSMLEDRWPGWEIGIPRPPELVPQEMSEIYQVKTSLLLSDFFRRVERGTLYCDYSTIIEKHGKGVESRIGKTSGLHFNLEAAYWTFNIKFNKWLAHNIETYGCSLACPLDEILARFDSYLREAFFPTPGPYDIGPKRRKKLQEQMLREFAPSLRKRLIKDIWG